MAKYWKNKKSWQKDQEREALEKIKHLSLTQVEEKIRVIIDKIETTKSNIKYNKEYIFKALPKAIYLFFKIYFYDEKIENIKNEMGQIRHNAKKRHGIIGIFSRSDNLTEEEKKKINSMQSLIDKNLKLKRKEKALNNQVKFEAPIVHIISKAMEVIQTEYFPFETDSHRQKLLYADNDFIKNIEDRELSYKEYTTNRYFYLGPVKTLIQISNFFSTDLYKPTELKKKIMNEIDITKESQISILNEFLNILKLKHTFTSSSMEVNLEFVIETKNYNNNKNLQYELNILKIYRSILNKHEKSARLKSYENKARDGTAILKTSLKKQLKILNKCPYCRKEIAFETCHADHIYPIAKGGLTTKSNMVLVCEECNRSKSKLTLRQFAKKYNLNLDQIEKDLDLLGKDF